MKFLNSFLFLCFLLALSSLRVSAISHDGVSISINGEDPDRLAFTKSGQQILAANDEPSVFVNVVRKSKQGFANLFKRMAAPAPAPASLPAPVDDASVASIMAEASSDDESDENTKLDPAKMFFRQVIDPITKAKIEKPIDMFAAAQVDSAEAEGQQQQATFNSKDEGTAEQQAQAQENANAMQENADANANQRESASVNMRDNANSAKAMLTSPDAGAVVSTLPAHHGFSTGLIVLIVAASLAGTALLLVGAAYLYRQRRMVNGVDKAHLNALDTLAKEDIDILP